MYLGACTSITMQLKIRTNNLQKAALVCWKSLNSLHFWTLGQNPRTTLYNATLKRFFSLLSRQIVPRFPHAPRKTETFKYSQIMISSSGNRWTTSFMMSRNGNNSRLFKTRLRLKARHRQKINYKMWKSVWKQERKKRNLRTLMMRLRTSQKITLRLSLPLFWKTKLTWKDSWKRWWTMVIWQETLQQKCNASLRLWGKKKNWRNIPSKEWKVCGPIQRAERSWGSSHASSYERDRWDTSLALKLRKKCPI